MNFRSDEQLRVQVGCLGQEGKGVHKHHDGKECYLPVQCIIQPVPQLFVEVLAGLCPCEILDGYRTFTGQSAGTAVPS